MQYLIANMKVITKIGLLLLMNNSILCTDITKKQQLRERKLRQEIEQQKQKDQQREVKRKVWRDKAEKANKERKAKFQVEYAESLLEKSKIQLQKDIKKQKKKKFISNDEKNNTNIKLDCLKAELTNRENKANYIESLSGMKKRELKMAMLQLKKKMLQSKDNKKENEDILSHLRAELKKRFSNPQKELYSGQFEENIRQWEQIYKKKVSCDQKK